MLLNKPEISVLMSVYNGEKYISKSIESIINQTYKEFEFLIINDGSSDRTANIINKYANLDSRIKVIHKENEGLTKSLNIGLSISRGEYIARQDCGDISHPSRLAKQIEFLKDNKDISACFTWTEIIDTSFNKISEIVFSTKTLKIQKNLTNGNNLYAHGSVMFRNQDIINVGLYDTNVLVSQDFELWLRLLKNGYKIGGIADFLYQWMLTSDSICIANYHLQKKYTFIALKKNNYNVGSSSYLSKTSENVLLHFYHNIYFRSQSRLALIKITFLLLKKKDLTLRELIKLIITLNPISYTWMFKFT